MEYDFTIDYTGNDATIPQIQVMASIIKDNSQNRTCRNSCYNELRFQQVYNL